MTTIETVKNSELARTFADTFGDAELAALYKCGEHRVDKTVTDDAFLDALYVAIAYQCLTTFHDSHGFIATSSDLKSWVRNNVDIALFDRYRDKDDMRKVFSKLFDALYAS